MDEEAPGPPWGEEDEEDAAPPPPPTAFGLEAEPWGCGIVGGLGFAALNAPLLMIYGGAGGWSGLGAGAGAVVGLAFGVATAVLVRRWVAEWRLGRSLRPPLWVAFTGMTVLGWTAVTWGAGLLVEAVGAVMG
jgi:hypothetical protein